MTRPRVADGASAFSSLIPVADADDGAAGRRSDRAYEQVRNAILRGEIPVGTVLAEADLAQALGISRTPVRAVLRRLLQEDLVEIGRRRQIIVRGLSPERQQEVFVLREALEAVGVRAAASKMSLDEIDQLRLLIMRQQRAAAAGRSDEFLELDEQFHLTIAGGARMPTLAKFLTQLRAFVRLMGVGALSREGRMAEVVQEHQAITDSLEARDAEAAAAAMLAHLAATAATLASDAQ